MAILFRLFLLEQIQAVEDIKQKQDNRENDRDFRLLND
jgi:hypothetical protein